MVGLTKDLKPLNISKKITKQIGIVNGKYNLIEEGDKILVAFSGGKDSLTLLHALKRMQKITPFNFEFKAVTITYGMGEKIDFLRKHCEEYEIEYEVVDTQIFDITQQKIRTNSSFCSFVSRMRRGYLYKYALENDYNKLALGHHLDDAMESFFMNFMYNGALRSMAPKYKANNGLEVIRPLIFCREKQLRDFAELNEILVIGDENCPGMQMKVKMPYARAKTKELLAQLESDNKKLFVSMKAAFQNIHGNSFFTQDEDGYMDEKFDLLEESI